MTNDKMKLASTVTASGVLVVGLAIAPTTQGSSQIEQLSNQVGPLSIPMPLS